MTETRESVEAASPPVNVESACLGEYKFVFRDEQMNFTEAENFCNSTLGGRVAAITSLEEFRFTKALTDLGNDICSWVGLKNEGTALSNPEQYLYTDPRFTNADRTFFKTSRKTPWAKSEPGEQSNQHCVCQTPDGWKNLVCDSGSGRFPLCRIQSEECVDSATAAPTALVTKAPSALVTESPSVAPSASPRVLPTSDPTTSPSINPTIAPTDLFRTLNPTTSPTTVTESPTTVTESPTTVIELPTTSPTISPFTAPTIEPTITPSRSPSIFNISNAGFENDDIISPPILGAIEASCFFLIIVTYLMIISQRKRLEKLKVDLKTAEDNEIKNDFKPTIQVSSHQPRPHSKRTL